MKSITGKPIKYVSNGEGMTDLEPFYPDRMASRILGMGDVLTLVEKAEESFKEEEVERLQNKIMSAKFDFNDFIEQLNNAVTAFQQNAWQITAAAVDGSADEEILIVRSLQYSNSRAAA